MPYGSTCTCPSCSTARDTYQVPENRANYVTARELGRDHEDAIAFVENAGGVVVTESGFEYHENERETDDDDGDDTTGYGNDEHALPWDLGRLLSNPLVRILNRNGRVWSAECEINGMGYSRAARILGCDTGGYSQKPQQDGYIISTSDCTVDAEIKLGRFRDGSSGLARNAARVYSQLRREGAGAGYNCGHHVHVDATRLVDLGTDAVDAVLSASLTLASACQPTLYALAATGYDQHRGSSYGGDLKERHDEALRSRTAWHASNARYCAQEGGIAWGSIPTFEYRLPNGTLFAERAHAHVAIALGLLDFGERCYEGDANARDTLRRATDRLTHGIDYSEADGAVIISRALDLHPHSRTALHIAAETAPLPAQAKSVFKIEARA